MSKSGPGEGCPVGGDILGGARCRGLVREEMHGGCPESRYDARQLQ